MFVQFLEFCEMFFQRVRIQMLSIQPIVPLVQRNTMVVNFSGKVNLPFKMLVSLVIVEFEFESLHWS